MRSGLALVRSAPGGCEVELVGANAHLLAAGTRRDPAAARKRSRTDSCCRGRRSCSRSPLRKLRAHRAVQYVLRVDLAAPLLAPERLLQFARDVAVGVGLAGRHGGFLAIGVHADQIVAGQGREGDDQGLARARRPVVAGRTEVGDLATEREEDGDQHPSSVHPRSTTRRPSRFPARSPTRLTARFARSRTGEPCVPAGAPTR